MPHKALGLMPVMRDKALSPDVITLNAAISASEKGSLVHRALGLISVMRREALSPYAITFSAPFSACEEVEASAPAKRAACITRLWGSWL